jgi:hypothetical protein
MREVTIFWRRERLHLANLGPLDEIFEWAMHMGYLERNPQRIRLLLRIIFREGYGPEDLAEAVDFIELDEVLATPTGGDPAHILIISLSHPLTQLSARVGKLTIKPGSRWDSEGMHYTMRGSALSIRIVVTAARLMLRPDRISATNVSPDDMLDEGLLSERQMEVLAAALQLGWYEVPRRITLADLAKHLDLGRSTVSEHLVRAEGSIIRQFLEGDPIWMAD